MGLLGIKGRNRGFEVVDRPYRTLESSSVYLPIRGTKTSAGYDFFATEDLKIAPQTTVKFKTDIKAYMKSDEVLLIDVRSSIGVKKDLMIANTLGVIDSDYYENIDNDGNMMIALRNLKPALELKGFKTVSSSNLGQPLDIPIINDLREANTVIIAKGEKVAQGIFMKFLPSDNCNTAATRTGGVGSTGEK